MEQWPVCEGSGQVASSEETMRFLVKLLLSSRPHARFYPLAETYTWVETPGSVKSWGEDWDSEADAIYDDQQPLGGP